MYIHTCTYTYRQTAHHTLLLQKQFLILYLIKPETEKECGNSLLKYIIYFLNEQRNEFKRMKAWWGHCGIFEMKNY